MTNPIQFSNKFQGDVSHVDKPYVWLNQMLVHSFIGCPPSALKRESTQIHGRLSLGKRRQLSIVFQAFFFLSLQMLINMPF